jgi:hypothetical protein
MLPLTVQEVGAHLPSVLADLAVTHMAARKRDKESCGFAGEGELASCDGNFVRGAARAGHVALLRKAAPDWLTVFHLGCEFGNMRTAEFAVAQLGPDVDRKRLWKRAFQLASHGGHADVARLAIAKGATNEEHSFECAFNTACNNGHASTVLLMLEHGVKNWRTGFAMACRAGHADIARTLLERTAARLARGATKAVQRYTEMSKDYPEVREHFPEISENFPFSKGALQHAITCALNPKEYFEDACASGKLPLVQAIAPYMYDLSPALNKACAKGHLPIVECLIAHGASGVDDALVFACTAGHLPIVEFLIANGAWDLSGGIHYARKHGHLPIVELLVAHGAIDDENWLPSCFVRTTHTR